MPNPRAILPRKVANHRSLKSCTAICASVCMGCLSSSNRILSSVRGDRDSHGEGARCGEDAFDSGASGASASFPGQAFGHLNRRVEPGEYVEERLERIGRLQLLHVEPRPALQHIGGEGRDPRNGVQPRS